MLFHKLLKHKDLQALLQKVQQQSKNTLTTVHHDGGEIHRILGRVKKPGEHHWWETLLGWSPTATGLLNTMLHPVLTMFALLVVCIAIIVFLYIRVCFLARSVYLIVKRTEYLATDCVELIINLN